MPEVEPATFLLVLRRINNPVNVVEKSYKSSVIAKER